MMAQHEVLSPLPGIFYRRPAPEKPAYKEDGDQVAEGDVVGLVEVMKQFTEIHADAGGKIVRFLVENEAPIEPGQAVLVIETA
jgi:acetyl-CoA carboxylase biotin carboxyl carrier protein